MTEENTAPKEKSEKKKKEKRKIIIKVCTSKKSCSKKFSKYIWERFCNENNVSDYEVERFEAGNLIFEKSGCLGECKRSPNIKVYEEGNEKGGNIFSYMNPLKSVKLLKRLKSGNKPRDIKNL